MKRTSAAAPKAFFISLVIAALISGFVIAYAQSGDLANCVRIREVSGGYGRKTRALQRYTLTTCARTACMVRATIRKHSQEVDEDTEYAIAEGGQLFVGCGGGGTSFAVVGCKVLKREAEKSDE